jgi:hypothetical protein
LSFRKLYSGTLAQQMRRKTLTFFYGGRKIRTKTTFIVFLTAIITLAAGSAFGKYSGGTGEPNNPYQIAAKTDLLDLAADTNDYGKCFILTADINMAGQVFTTAIIAPDTNSSNGFQGMVFTGTFDGKSHKITNFSINGGSKDYLGLFGYIDAGGAVKNLGLADFAVSGTYHVSGLAGLNSGSISNCYSADAVSGTSNSYMVGGLVGFNYGSISNCCSTGNVSGSEEVGGLVGYNYLQGSISNCWSTGAVSSTSNSYIVGGLVGLNYAGISQCYSTGSVSGTYYIGGLVGENDSGSISNCYSTGNIIGSKYVGGLVGLNYAGISDCYSTGAVSGTSDVGGLVGENDSGSISGGYFLVTSGPNNGYGTPLTNAQMKQQSSFVGWDFTDETANGTNDYWRMCVDGLYYPHFRWEYSSRGDFVCPDRVDFYDFAVFADQWLLKKLSADVAPGGGDGIVNFIDYTVFADGWLRVNDMNDLADFASQWLKPSAYSADIAPPPGGDGVVNMLDFAIFAENWLKGVTP